MGIGFDVADEERRYRVCLHQGGPKTFKRLAQVFFPILPENLTSHPVGVRAISPAGGKKKSECSICVLSVSKMAITFNRLPIVSLFLVKVQRNLSSFASFY